MPPRAPTVAAAAAVPSSDPSRDAESLAALLGPRFVRPNGGGGAGSSAAAAGKTSSVVLSSDGDGSFPSTAVVFVDFGPQQEQEQNEQQEAPRTLAPNATLMVTADLIASVADSDISEENGAIKYSLHDNHSWAVIRLSGGATLLLASSVQAVFRYASAAAKDDDSLIENGDKGIVGSHGEIEEPPYKFPSLAMGILSNKQVIPGFTINTRVGVPIESDLFVGQVLLIMRPPDPTADPYWNEKVFSKKKRRLEIQIQGRFKYVPQGTVWAGFEVTEQMKLGLVAKGLCNLLLRLVSKTVPGEMHFSFGDRNNEELPHISSPAWTMFDRVVVTKSGETPPPLGEVLPEPAKVASQRKKSGKTGDWNTEDTYSFSYHSMYMDLSIWHVVNLPTADMELKTFWRDSLLRIVVYENDSKPGERHLKAENKYIAGIQAEYLGFEDEGINSMLEENAAVPLDQNKLSKISRSISVASFNQHAENDTGSLASFTPSIQELDISATESDEETLFYDAADEARSENENASVEGVGLEVGQEVQMNDFIGGDVPDNMLLYDMICPGWVEICSPQKGKYTKVFAFARAGTSVTNENVIFRTSSEFAQLFPLSEAKLWVEENCSPRLSNLEKHRRIMGYTLAGGGRAASARSERRCRELWSQPGSFDNAYLQRAPPRHAKWRKENVLFSGYVGRSLSERHWIEEWVEVTDRLISFYHPDHKRPSYRIHLRGVLGAKEFRGGSDCPYFPTYHFLAVETVSRVIYVMFRSRDDFRKILDALQNKLESQEGASPAIDLSPLAFDDPSQEYLHKSSLYKCDQRRLLNNRKFAFDSLGKIGFDDREGVSAHPLALVQDALRKIMAPNLMDITDKTILEDFLDAASELKRTNLTGLSETQKLAFYLNLYHVMVMHGFLVFGPPVTLFAFVNYFGKVAYEVGDDIFSLKELEHNIIRANMTSPSQLVGRFVLPKQVYKHALKKGDCRINFALNCGSNSNPDVIQVYTVKDLGSQLDEASREYLKVVKASTSGKSLTLPKMCQWYANDFGEGRNKDVVKFLLEYLKEEEQRLLSSSLADVRLRYIGYDCKCRHLKLIGS